MQIKKYQMGGEAPAAAPAAPAQPQDPVMEVDSLMAQALQTGDCNIAMQACEAFLMLLQQASGPEQAPVGQAPEGQPVFKKGGKVVKRVKKSCK
jgi:hypothetical protein